MSIAAIDKVIKTSNLSGSAFTALIMIADYAEDDGTNAHPTYPSLAAKTRLKTTRSAIRIVDQLMEAGELVKHVGKGTRTGRGSDGNSYDIVYQDGSNWQEIQERCKQFKTPLPPQPQVCYDLKIARAMIKGDEMDTLKGDEMDTLKGDEMDTQSPSVESVIMNPVAPDQNDESSLNEFFPRPDLPAESNGQKQQGLKQPRDPFAPFHAVASRNEEKSFDPKQHPAYHAFEAIRPAYELPELEKNFYHCRDACGFDGEHAWLAAAFLTYTDLPTSALTGAGKIARDTRKMWRDEMDVYLANDSLPKVLSYYHYAVEEMVEDGLSINSPHSIRNKVAEIIARSKRANGGERYVARQKV